MVCQRWKKRIYFSFLKSGDRQGGSDDDLDGHLGDQPAAAPVPTPGATADDHLTCASVWPQYRPTHPWWWSGALLKEITKKYLRIKGEILEFNYLVFVMNDKLKMLMSDSKEIAWMIFFCEACFHIFRLRAIEDYASLKSLTFTSGWNICLKISFLSRPGLDPLFPQGQVQPLRWQSVPPRSVKSVPQKSATCFHHSAT